MKVRLCESTLEAIWGQILVEENIFDYVRGCWVTHPSQMVKYTWVIHTHHQEFLQNFRFWSSKCTKIGCSYRTGGWTNLGQNLDKCLMFVQGLSKVCPRFVNVLVLSNNFWIFGQLSKLYLRFVLGLSKFSALSKFFFAIYKNWTYYCSILVQTLSSIYTETSP